MSATASRKTGLRANRRVSRAASAVKVAAPRGGCGRPERERRGHDATSPAVSGSGVPPRSSRYASSRDGSACSTPSRTRPPTLRYRPVPVRQETFAAGSGCVGQPDPARRLAGQLGDRAVVADPAAVQHDHPLAQRRDILGLVGGQHHDRSPRELREHGPQRSPAAPGRPRWSARPRSAPAASRAAPAPARPAAAGRRTWPGSAWRRGRTAPPGRAPGALPRAAPPAGPTP